MVTFITSVRHPLNATSFQRVEALLDRSLRSVSAQTDPDIRVIVVCNQRPNVRVSDSRIDYHIVDFPPPSEARRASIPEELARVDKGTKQIVGFLAARAFRPEYVVFFDCDDLVNRELAAFVAARPGRAGWYVNTGYALDMANGHVQRRAGMVRYCGTALVLNAARLAELTGVGTPLTPRSSQDEIRAHVAPVIITRIFGDHPFVPGFFAAHGHALASLPFAASAWVLGTGENLVGVRKRDVGLPATARFYEAFGIEPPDASADPVSWTAIMRERWSYLRSQFGFAKFLVSGFRPPPAE
ncbi:MAG TPA: glycosyltransferase family A protein [Vicinamibacterales bacterium]|jgi:hypothetical protein|nr:glycosyltransferase family A protein [Vicinamibacterales bacterium]